MYFIGLISGTSADAVDAAAVSFVEGREPRVVGTHSHPVEQPVRAAIHSLTRAAGDELRRVGELDVVLGEVFARAALDLIESAGLTPAEISAIGSHGQTVRHHPEGDHPFTVQIGSPAIIAERTGIATIADFRRRDMAAGGQGAPLAPAFHDAVFRSPDHGRAIVNLGGIANLTWLSAAPGEPVLGFDTGPANTLLDAWIQSRRGKPFDRDGAWSASGRVHEGLLSALLDEAYFRRPPPKSTGPEHFNLDWLGRKLETVGERIADEDVQATLARLTAETVADAIVAHAAGANEVYLCGGGAHNPIVRRCLAERLPGVSVDTTSHLGIDPDWVEAATFAWLAHRTLEHRCGNLPSVTGARRAVVLGAIWPGAGVDAEVGGEFVDGG
jgi:anhydro-N-acetylmuramic acid kinase